MRLRLRGRLVWLLEQAPSRSRAPIWVLAVVAGVAGFVESVRSIVSSVGWIEAGGAGGGLVLLLLAWLGWAEWQRAHRQRNGIPGDSTVVPVQATRELKGQLNVAERQHRQYQDELFAIAVRSMRPMSESLRIRYEIGANPMRDRTTVIHESVARDPDRPIRWTILKAWADGNAAKMPSFRELFDVEAFEIDPSSRAEAPMRILDVGPHDRALCALALFNSELTIVPRHWRWSYCWPGMWNPLRQQSLDWTEYDPRPTAISGHIITSLSITFVFPPNAIEPKVRLRPGPQYCREVLSLDSRYGGRAFTFHLDDPKHVLHWDLGVSTWGVGLYAHTMTDR